MTRGVEVQEGNHRGLAGSAVSNRMQRGDAHREDTHRGDGGRRGGAAEWLITAANPRDVDAALDWQLERVGSRAWQDWSLKFQRMAFGYSLDTGWHDEAEARRWLTDHGHLYDGLPPRGALVWYDDGGTPRVACSLGRGRVVGAIPVVAIADLDCLSASYRWSAPLFPFAH